ncbi:MAG: diaminopimelate epimerase [Lachnospiraceae bacterium]|nr:diaminopimelate epimerase [Lachnospiraceae bacterium]
MKFTKMHGCGNDYIYFNCFEETVDDPAALSIRLSDRHKGIGGDGIILIKPSDKADCFMDMYNLDGSRGKMCGNAIRCVGKYIYEHKLTDKKEVTVETLSGIKNLKLMTAAEFTVSGGSIPEEMAGVKDKDSDGRDIISFVTVDMGAPITDIAAIPLNTDIIKEYKLGYSLAAEARTFRFTFVSMGNPHAVTFVDDIMTAPVEELGPAYEHHEIFPEQANIEFVHVLDRGNIEFRVWERGSGETQACGTGACASTYASILNGFTDDEINVKMLGGTLRIRYDRALDRVFMTGPAVEVFTGETAR